jgi:hypothetical protein
MFCSGSKARERDLEMQDLAGPSLVALDAVNIGKEREGGESMQPI